MKIQKILFALVAVNLLATITWGGGQNINDKDKSSSSFFEISGVFGVNAPMQLTQIGTAHLNFQSSVGLRMTMQIL